MSIYIYNSLTRKKEEFIPLNPGVVNMYTCGVTVYDNCHVGHGRSLYIFEVMRRYLEYRGYRVNFVRNITDVDDKIINRAQELNTDWQELVNKYIESYYHDIELLGVRKGLTDEKGIEPRATVNIPQMIEYIKKLIDKGSAYSVKSGVYFNVRNFKNYGKLSGQSIDEMLSGVRKDSDEDKLDPLDFALWKTAKDGEPSWDSPWGKGRPGWHIECSVMSQRFLNTFTLDIHAGGRDLIFPHHENEIAQAEALTGMPFARYWVHHGLLTINGQKMSKSLGNFITIQEFFNKHKGFDFLKLFFLGAHYTSPVDFTDEKIQEAKRAYERVAMLISKLDDFLINYRQESEDHPLTKSAEEIKEKFISYMDDDFNTPKALSVVFDLVTRSNIALEKGKLEHREFLFEARKLLSEFLNIFILQFSLEASVGGISEKEVEVLINSRVDYKKKKMFQEADKIRKDLEAMGVILEDTKDGKTTWRRKI